MCASTNCRVRSGRAEHRQSDRAAVINSHHLEITGPHRSHTPQLSSCARRPPAPPLAVELIKTRKNPGIIYQSDGGVQAVTRCSLFIWQCGWCFHTSSNDMLLQPVYFTWHWGAPTVYEQWTTEHITHGQAFPQKGTRIISDSGCLGARARTIRWLWDLKGKELLQWASDNKVERGTGCWENHLGSSNGAKRPRVASATDLMWWDG